MAPTTHRVVKVSLATSTAGNDLVAPTRRTDLPAGALTCGRYGKVPRCTWHTPFTLVEILVVLAILGFVLALVLPRIGKLPRRLLIQNGLSQIRMAFRDAGTRARASGNPTSLVLHPDSHEFRIENGVRQGESAAGANPLPGSGPGNSGKGGSSPNFLSKLSSYKVPAEITWKLEGVVLDEGKAVTYSFFPGGEASGTALEFELSNAYFVLDVDRLTGRPIITEVER